MDVGTAVCMKGTGMDATVHFHTKVARITKTMIVTTSGRRFRREPDMLGHHKSIPYQPYGGTYLSTKCQKKGK